MKIGKRGDASTDDVRTIEKFGPLHCLLLPGLFILKLTVAKPFHAMPADSWGWRICVHLVFKLEIKWQVAFEDTELPELRARLVCQLQNREHLVCRLTQSNRSRFHGNKSIYNATSACLEDMDKSCEFSLRSGWLYSLEIDINVLQGHFYWKIDTTKH